MKDPLDKDTSNLSRIPLLSSHLLLQHGASLSTPHTTQRPPYHTPTPPSCPRTAAPAHSSHLAPVTSQGRETGRGGGSMSLPPSRPVSSSLQRTFSVSLSLSLARPQPNLLSDSLGPRSARDGREGGREGGSEGGEEETCLAEGFGAARMSCDTLQERVLFSVQRMSGTEQSLLRVCVCVRACVRACVGVSRSVRESLCVYVFEWCFHLWRCLSVSLCLYLV
jgi:hypothetical protein